MSVAMEMLTYTTVFIILMWVPYITAAFFTRGIFGVLGYPENPQPLQGWADRAKRAHENLVQNYAPFAALVIIAELAGAESNSVGYWAGIFLLARIVHWVVYILKVPVVRTLAFLTGFAAQLMILVEIAEIQSLWNFLSNTPS